MLRRSLAAALAAVAVLGMTASAALAHTERIAPAARGLRLSPAQQTNIRRIIDRGHVNGMSTVATQHAVLRVLTPQQRLRLQQLVPVRGKPQH